MHYRTFFEISTLLVILIQNIYYGDSRHQRQLISTIANEDQEMTINPSSSKIVKKNNKKNSKKSKNTENPLTKELSNSAYFYFNDPDNIIDENKLRKAEPTFQTIKATADDDEIYFDKNQVATKINGKPDSNPSNETTVDFNDSLQANEHEINIRPNIRRQNLLRRKIGIFFSYSNSKVWIMVLCAFCSVYYIFAYITLVRAVERSFLLFVVPLVHPAAVLLAWANKKCCFYTTND